MNYYLIKKDGHVAMTAKTTDDNREKFSKVAEVFGGTLHVVTKDEYEQAENEGENDVY